MTVKWRWDQGRLDYFFFDNIRLFARALVEVDGTALNSGPDPLRPALARFTSLSFPPANNPAYRVWRNFGRIFQLELLAANVDGRLICTSLCHAVAEQAAPLQTADDYFHHLVRRTYFPSPALSNYEAVGERVFPFCAVLKLLAGNVRDRGQGSVTVTEVFQRLIGNEVSGMESVADLSRLKATSRKSVGDEGRQVRELLRVLSQLTFLKWSDSTLILDLTVNSELFVADIERLAVPTARLRESDPDREVLLLGSVEGAVPRPITGVVIGDSEEEKTFEEGDRVASYHLRSERSAALRKAFFAAEAGRASCDVCELEPPRRYPWVGNMLELHHLLPLSSAVKVGQTRTALTDLVPVCPNCHRATHSYYRQWLKTKSQKDFSSASEARLVYDEAKESISL